MRVVKWETTRAWVLLLTPTISSNLLWWMHIRFTGWSWSSTVQASVADRVIVNTTEFARWEEQQERPTNPLVFHRRQVIPKRFHRSKSSQPCWLYLLQRLLTVLKLGGSLLPKNNHHSDWHQEEAQTTPPILQPGQPFYKIGEWADENNPRGDAYLTRRFATNFPLFISIKQNLYATKRGCCCWRKLVTFGSFYIYVFIVFPVSPSLLLHPLHPEFYLPIYSPPFLSSFIHIELRNKTTEIMWIVW